MQLTQAQRDQYERDGFLVLPGLFSPAEVAECVRSLTDDAGTLDLGHLLRPSPAASATSGKKSAVDRSEYEDVS